MAYVRLMVFAFVGFVVFIGLLVSLDLGVVGRRREAMTLRESLIWSAVWISISLAFSLVVYDGFANHRFGLGHSVDLVDGHVNDGSMAATKFLTGWILEKALSVDNLFVIAVIFRFLAIPVEMQHRVLFWGIFGSMIMRGGMIAVGVELLTHYHWMLYIFGGFLVATGVKMLFAGHDDPDPSKSLTVRIARRVLPLTSRFYGLRLVVRENGRLVLTPLALAMILIEVGDVVFAVDSVPAVFAITADPLLVFTSNVLAIVGLRSLYFALAGLLQKFDALKYSLALILALVGVKMIGGHHVKLLVGAWGTPLLLGMIALLIVGGIIASLRHQRAELPEPKKLPEPAALS
jgi:tellurite resistance protein TerC